jgi:glycerate 2-kinase
LAAASPRSILRNSIGLNGGKLHVGSLKLNLSRYDRIIVIGGGKATASMAFEIEKLLGTRITVGAVNVPDYLKRVPKTKKIILNRATHPIPSAMGVRGVEKMLKLIGTPTKRDLVICLISGGGSALMPLPLDGLELSDDQKITGLLLKSGAPINEINTVRKHLSAVKGGRLAQRLFPARVLTLIISDVVGDPLDAIASGPTVPDLTTYADARKILLKYGLWGRIPKRVKKIIAKGLTDPSMETPKANSDIFRHVSNILVGTNKQSCDYAAEYLRSAGYKTKVLSTHVQGEAKEIGKLYAGILSDMMDEHSPTAIVAGGETTVSMSDNAGLGGRNQELVLSCAIGIEGIDGAVIASIGTDGVDGPTNAAGAIADHGTIERARKRDIDASESLQNHDSYHFFEKIGGLLFTGPTGTNVNDITVLAVK